MSQIEGLSTDNNNDKTELQDALEKAKLEFIHTKLIENGMESLDLLIFMDDNGLNELCDLLQLNGFNKIKFKSIIRKFQSKHKSKNKQNLIRVTTNEQKEINKIENIINQINSTQQLFEKYHTQIDENVANTLTNIDEKIKQIFKLLQDRQKSLHKEVYTSI